MTTKKINFGCGSKSPKHWMNFDISMRVWLDKVPFLPLLGYQRRFAPWVKRLDVCRSLPFESSSIDCIYSSHMIEHLPFENANFFVSECFRILKVGGKIRILAPSLFNNVEDYLNRRKSFEFQKNAADNFMYDLGVTHDKSSSFLKVFLHGGKQKNIHHWMYDEYSLAALLERGGFLNPVCKHDWKTDFVDLEEIESEVLREKSICAEAVKIT